MRGGEIGEAGFARRAGKELNKRLLAALSEFVQGYLSELDLQRTKAVLTSGVLSFTAQALAILGQTRAGDLATARRIDLEGHTEEELRAILLAADDLLKRLMGAIQGDKG